MGPVSATELFDPPSDDPVPVDRLMVASAYWDGRDDAPTKDAEGVLSLLTRLAAINPSMSEWKMVVGKKGETAPLAGDAAGLAEQMAERTRAAEIAPGVSAMLVSKCAFMLIRLGVPTGAKTNFVVLRPGSPDVREFWLARSSSLLSALVDTFAPDTAVVGSSRHSEAQPRRATLKQDWIGAITYAKELPESNGIPMSKLGNGKVIDLTDGGRRLPTTNEALKAYESLYGGNG